MNSALLVGLGSVVLGGGLALWRPRAMAAPLRTFAVVAATVVVLAELLPTALESVGLWALLVAALAFAVPALLERLGWTATRGSGEGRFGLELGFAALLIHKVADGLALAVFTGGQHEGHLHLDVLLGIAAHTVPVVSVVVMAFRARDGLRSALARTAGLALATAIGALLPGAVPAEILAAADPWIAALAAGLLLHVVAHRDTEPRPTTRWGRAAEVGAVLLGLSLLLLGGHHHDDHAGELRGSIGASFVDLLLETAPALLIGLVIGSLLQVFGSRIPLRWLRRGSSFRQAFRGAVVGAPLPLCACGVLPVAHSLRSRGAGPALVVAFLLATPELGVETFALTVRFLGWEMAFVRLGSAVALAIVAALVVAKTARRDEPVDAHGRRSELPVQGSGAGSLPRRMVEHFEELLFHVGPWTLVGLLAAAYVEASLPSESLEHLSTWGLDVLLVSVIAVPSYVCAASATPLAAVLLAKGFSPGAVIVGLLLGPATNVATVGFLRAQFGGRATWFGIGAILLTAWAFALALNLLPLDLAHRDPVEHAHHGHGPLAWTSAAVLGAVTLRSFWSFGLFSWFATVGDTLGLGGHGHGHGGHGHGGHGHGHGH